MDQVAPKIIRLSASDFPERNRVQSFLDIYGPTIIKHDIETLGDDPFQFDATLYALPNLGLAMTTVSSCRAPRRRQHIDSDDLVLSIVLNGGRAVCQESREALTRDGEAILTSGDAVGTVTVPATSRLMSLRIPRAILRPTTADLDSALLRPIVRQTPALQLLTDYSRAIGNVAALATPELRRLAVAHVHDLVSLTIGATRDAAELAQGRGVRAARLRLIKQEIMAKLNDENLTIGAVAARHGITSRYVSMLFEAEGTSFSEFVLGRRLARAHRLLSDPRHATRMISTIAYGCGFGDPSYFNRAFRRQYGATPSDVRAAARWNEV